MTLEKKYKDKQRKYSFINDRKLVGISILLSCILLQIFEFINTPFLSTIHAYTIGVLFGQYSFVVYLYGVLVSITMLFKPMKLFNVLRFTKLSYLLLAIAGVMTASTWTFYNTQVGLIKNTFGTSAFHHSFNNWWTEFSNPKDEYWNPHSIGAGIIGALLFSIFSSFSTGLGAAIIFTFLLGLAVSFAITGSFIGLYRGIVKSNRHRLEEKEMTTEILGDLTKVYSMVNKDSPFLDIDEDLNFLESSLLTSKISELPFEDIPNLDTSATEIEQGISKINKWEEYQPINSGILSPKKSENIGKINFEVMKRIKDLDSLFESFSLEAKVVDKIIGPTITKFIVEVAPGVNLKKIEQIEKNIKMTLASPDIRLELPIPGQSKIGIEVGNQEKSLVTFGEVFKKLPKNSNPLAVAFGQTIEGNPLIININETPHMLIAGVTGSGKSVAINTIICSIIMNQSPRDVRFVLVDPKFVEFTSYEGIPHLLAPIITDPKNASIALKVLTTIMDDRYQEMSKYRVRNIEEYNITAAKNKLEHWPYIVVIIDELADLMSVAAKLVENSIQRITQKARAAGIHLVVSTQRPSTNVITGVIKANIPSRIAFAVSSGIDSKVILDEVGAESLIGCGDMLMSLYGKHIERAQGAYLSSQEIDKITNNVKVYGAPNYDGRFNFKVAKDLDEEVEVQQTEEVYNDFAND